MPEAPPDFIDNLLLPEELRHNYLVDERSIFLTSLNKVNLFVGPNNSGKSRLIRHILKKQTTLNANKLKNQARKIDEYCLLARRYNGVLCEAGKAYWLPVDVADDASLTAQNDYVARVHTMFEEYQRKSDWSEDLPGGDLQQRAKDSLAKLNTEPPTENILSVQSVYLPSLRSLRTIDGDGANLDSFEQRTRSDYREIESHIHVLTGLSFYRQLRSLLLSSHKDRQMVRDFEVFLRDRFFSGEEITLTPVENDDIVSMKIGNEERRISDLGDGLQQLIILSFAAFTARDKRALIAIEEPELYLHPGMQRQLMTLFTESDGPFAHAQIFAATHSNHLIDMSLDYNQVSLFRIRQQAFEHTPQRRFVISPVSPGDECMLGDLGVNISSTFIVNCTIWVEGITDRIYYRKFLALYLSTLKEVPTQSVFLEDIHYSFAEYGGATLDHWIEGLEKDTQESARAIKLKRLCGKALIIADKDSCKNDSHNRRKQILGNQYEIIETREVENLLPPGAIVAAIRSFPKARISVTQAGFSHNDYAQEYLGGFIDEKLLASDTGKKFKADSGTVRDKLEFATNAVAALESWEELPLPAQEITKKIWEHITSHNRRCTHNSISVTE